MTFKNTVDKTLPCIVEGCSYNSTTVNQLCTSHYYMVRTAMQKGEISFEDALEIVNNKRRRPSSSKKTCTHSNCNINHYAKGLCRNHYAKFNRTQNKLKQLDTYA